MNPDWLKRLQSFLGGLIATGASSPNVNPNFMQGLMQNLVGSATWEQPDKKAKKQVVA